jgi:CRISPR/Cas system-associated endonuclease Cas3-HD
MKTFHTKSAFSAFFLALILCISACGPSKQDKEKYHSEIKVIVDKAERNAEFVAKLMKSDSANSESAEAQIANLTVGIEALDKFDADLKVAKADLAKVATPKFDDFNLKSSTDKWLDAQIKGTSDMKGAFQELISAMKSVAEIQKAAEEGTEVSDERRAAILKQLEGMNIDKKFRDIETAMHNAKNEVQTNEEKFIMQNSLTVTKFVVGNL